MKTTKSKPARIKVSKSHKRKMSEFKFSKRIEKTSEIIGKHLWYVDPADIDEEFDKFIKDLKAEINETTKNKEFLSGDYDLALIYSFECKIREIIDKLAEKKQEIN